jgi:hypothetical protein
MTGQKEVEASSKWTYKLEVTWIKGNTEVEGNEKVDIEAKKATEGKSSKVHNLPQYLANNPLPLSMLAARQKYE